MKEQERGEEGKEAAGKVSRGSRTVINSGTANHNGRRTTAECKNMMR
jgi:hypothetical protein